MALHSYPANSVVPAFNKLLLYTRISPQTARPAVIWEQTGCSHSPGKAHLPQLFALWMVIKCIENTTCIGVDMVYKRQLERRNKYSFTCDVANTNIADNRFSGIAQRMYIAINLRRKSIKYAPQFFCVFCRFCQKLQSVKR